MAANIGDRAGWERIGQPVDIVVADRSCPEESVGGACRPGLCSDEPGSSWRAVGRALPEPATTIRGIAANAEATILVVTTNRGLYRSENGGETWMLKEDNLPIHLEAGPLAQDPGDAGVLYAVYSLCPIRKCGAPPSRPAICPGRLDPI